MNITKTPAQPTATAAVHFCDEHTVRIEDIKEKAMCYHHGLVTLHELVMYVHDVTQGGTVQTLNQVAITISFVTKLPLGDVVTTVDLPLVE